MLLRELTLQNFRNIGLANLEFSGRRHFLLGANGQGKTNLLEAVGYVTALRSFRTAENRLLIRRGETEAAIACLFEHEERGETPVQVRIQSGSRQVVVDQERVTRLADMIGRFPTVVFSSDDIQLIRGSPSGRRRWMDLVLAAADPEYFRVLQRYHQALQRRNSLLKQRGSPAELKSFELLMAPAALSLIRLRQDQLGRLAGHLASHYGSITSGQEEGTLQYRPDLLLQSEEAFLKQWTDGRNRDLQYAATQRGPHRDELLLQVNRKPAKDFGSEGQQRGLVLALRLAQIDFFRSRLRLQPVLLADDIVNELDPLRRQSFWRAVGPEMQLIATGTSLPAAGDWQVFAVEEGRFTAR
jgi:DNA replication and repair protein RecF